MIRLMSRSYLTAGQLQLGIEWSETENTLENQSIDVSERKLGRRKQCKVTQSHKGYTPGDHTAYASRELPEARKGV